jgi:O-succinylbenzoic acid--CoA ligase
VHRLVALDLAGGAEFVDELRRAWDDGDAVLPVDQRLPHPAKDALLRRMGASRVVSAHEGTVSVAELPDGFPVESGDAIVVATSGSTGEPKGVVLTHDAVAASATATSHRLGVRDDDRWLACLPLAHVGGLSVVTRALHTGTDLVVHPGFSPTAVEESGATLVSLVATALARIDATRFRTIVLGGSRPPTDRPPNTVTTYGMTETGSGVVYDRRPLDEVEIRVVDGEILLRCPMLLRCYRDGTDPRGVDGWFPTGDLGSFDDGLLTVHGRRGDLIISGGENVWPEPVEAVLRTHPSVGDVAVIGRPDPEWGEIVVAVVVPNGDPAGLDELRDHVKATLPAFCAPRAVVFRTGLPRTALGKLRRAELDADDH